MFEKRDLGAVTNTMFALDRAVRINKIEIKKKNIQITYLFCDLKIAKI